MSNSVKDIPVIKLFIFENRFYLYDTYCNRLLEVTRGQYIELAQLQVLGESAYMQLEKGTKDYLDVLMLIKKGMLRYGFIKEIEHNKTGHIYDLLDSCVNDMVLQVTKDCNFQCRYCMFAGDSGIDRTHKRENMPWDIAKKSVDFLYNHSADAEIVTISFYGGEPLMNFNLISDVVEYSQKIFATKKVKYRMTINGSLLNDKIIDFLIKYKFDLSISFDGPVEIQNLHRKFKNSGNGSFDIVYRNVQKLKEKNQEYFYECVYFMPVVISDENYRYVIDYFKDLGININHIHLLNADLSGIDYYLKYNNEKNIIQKDGVLENVTEEKLYDIYSDQTPIKSKWHHNGTCIPGVKRLFVDTQGILYPCEKIVLKPNLSIGSIESGFDVNKIIKFMNIGKLSEEKCKSCWAMRYCETCVAQCNDIEKEKITSEQKQKNCSEQLQKTLWYFKRIIQKNSSK